MTAATYDFAWVRGTTTPLKLSFMINGLPIPYTDVRLSVYKDKGKTLAFRMSLLDNPGTVPGTVQEVAPGIIQFMPTAAQTRSLTVTPNDGTPGRNLYEVEVRNNTDEEVYVMGTIAGIGGINDDEV